MHNHLLSACPIMSLSPNSSAIWPTAFCNIAAQATFQGLARGQRHVLNVVDELIQGFIPGSSAAWRYPSPKYGIDEDTDIHGSVQHASVETELLSAYSAAEPYIGANQS
ncbi:hypothetical protein C8J56DRAFT_1056503 [Mycena floridula]|nr:hypothetical protein C8J56DRAFT_1056503 [Mycena floridula]